MTILPSFPRAVAIFTVVTALLLVGGFGFRRLPASMFTTGPTSAPAASDTLGDLPVGSWLNASAPVDAAQLRGDVVLVEYWTYLCYNCRNVQPWMKSVHAKYAAEGLRVVGIHTPEFNEERSVTNVRRYLDQNGITWPIGIDNDYRVWDRYNTTNAWPAFFVYDRRGRLLFHAAGENAVDAAEAVIRRALADTAGRHVASTPGIHLETRRTAGGLRLTLAPLPGFKLVRSPANEVWLDGRTDAPAALIGEPLHEGPGAEVVYFGADDRGAVTLPALAPRGAPLRGRVVYHYCSEADRVCLQATAPFEG